MRLRTCPGPAEAGVLLLHGGRADGLDAPSLLNLPGLRMRPFGAAVLRASNGHAVALGEVRYRHRGWNGDRADTVRDARAAHAELTGTHGPLPVVAVGHSMGARAALRIGGDPGLSGVVALAPWCPPGEPVAHLAGRRVVLVHSDRDRITDPAGSLHFALRARQAGAEVCRVVIPGSDHAMLRRAADWHGLAGRLVAGLLGLADLPADIAAALAIGRHGNHGLALPTPPPTG
ncbi:alpha/beta hydrolase [Streptomyces sp. MTZ3.1]|uniref:Alpha/beta hydrolase n=1 Tax=Streptomyces meridianus TaxID=2938945 RepID=A0ABT0X9U5_9ACTN|nr:alpha/beta hydrolase [Streptomyces meridianus]